MNKKITSNNNLLEKNNFFNHFFTCNHSLIVEEVLQFKNQLDYALLYKILKKDQLINLYDEILNIEKYFDFIYKIRRNDETFSNVFNIKEIKNLINEFLLTTLDDDDDLKDVQNKFCDILIVLGCNNYPYKFLEQRVDKAIEYLNMVDEFKIKTPIIIASGGGFNNLNSEAEKIKDKLKKFSVLIENFSLDTIGNALFSSLLLEKHKVRYQNITVITTDFHAMRTKNIFSKIFYNKNINIIATDSREIIGKKLEQKSRKDYIHHSMTSEIFSNKYFFFDLEKNHNKASNYNDFLSFYLIKLIMHHKMYENRYDILRFYYDQLTY